jgi:predicted 3-demethylubiquinone-9 3-methyltransferase (glyoxalase superfamily)
VIRSTARRETRLCGALFTACVLCLPAAVSAQSLIISEFRLRGSNGANDEFIEIYNSSNSNHTVSSISGTGYGLAASDGTTRCSIPNGTVIPSKGHYLCVNSVGYSLATYPAGSSATATGNATYTTDIPDNAGIGLFNNNTGSYSLANRFDAVGSTSEANTLYKEGTGVSGRHATQHRLFVRPQDHGRLHRLRRRRKRKLQQHQCGSDDSWPDSLTLQDTGNNANDFTLFGQRFQAISAGPHHEFNDAISIAVLCDDQAELDRYWNALLEQGGKPQACGWLIDRFGLRWQIVPAALDEWMRDADPARSKRVAEAMLKMVKLDVAALEKAYRS